MEWLFPLLLFTLLVLCLCWCEKIGKKFWSFCETIQTFIDCCWCCYMMMIMVMITLVSEYKVFAKGKYSHFNRWRKFSINGVYKFLVFRAQVNQAGLLFSLNKFEWLRIGVYIQGFSVILYARTYLHDIACIILVENWWT